VKYSADFTTWSDEPGSPTTFTAASAVRHDSESDEGLMLREKASGKYYRYYKASGKWAFTGITAPAGAKLEMEIDGNMFLCLAEGNSVWHYDDANGWKKRTTSSGGPLIPADVTVIDIYESRDQSLFLYIDSTGLVTSLDAEGKSQGTSKIDNLPSGTIQAIGIPMGPSPQMVFLSSDGAMVFVAGTDVKTAPADPGRFFMANDIGVHTLSTRP